MTHSVSRASVIALGVAALVSLSALSARADTLPPGAASPSLAEPSPTPGWAESGPQGPKAAQRPAARRHAHHYYTRHYASRSGRRYAYSSDNPVATAATGVVGGVADLGSIAAYPFYCFPDYGSCSVRVPYRF
ncbi:MAG TPA: hypothetical protein VKR62_07940 [Roseiarcus sp.]|nr:hypothetical protein [Roseiarcus sp.]